MGSLDHSGSRTIMSIKWQSTLIDMSRCFISSWHHLVDRKRSSGSATGSSRAVPLHSPHTSKESFEWLNQRFSDQLISRKCDPQWVPYLPDLNPSDVYLWGYLKDRIYVHNPQSIPDLKREIKATIKAIPREECKKIIDKLASRIQVYLQRQGAHFEENVLSLSTYFF